MKQTIQRSFLVFLAAGSLCSAAEPAHIKRQGSCAMRESIDHLDGVFCEVRAVRIVVMFDHQDDLLCLESQLACLAVAVAPVRRLIPSI